MNEDTLSRDPLAVVREGAAADGIDEGKLAKLPRLVRYALISGGLDTKARIVAELAELAPGLVADAAAWADDIHGRGWKRLAGELDAASVDADKPTLRSLSDAVRMVSMTLAEVKADTSQALRVVAALNAAMSVYGDRDDSDTEVLSILEQTVIGWVHLIAVDSERWARSSAIAHGQARFVGREMTRQTRDLVQERAWDKEQKRREAEVANAKPKQPSEGPVQVPDGHVLVCPPIDTKSNAKVRDAAKGHEHAIGVPLPLAPMPDIAAVRRGLVAEFPYAADAVDALLRPLVGRATVRFPPVVLVGPPGCGKSRLARRLAETLGIGLWRTDGAGSGGASFGGLERRWYSAEPAHPFLAVSRFRIANPVALVDEIEKAPTRQDYGRLWDSMLGLLEPETAGRYPDPCLQTDLDLSHVSYVATANSLLPLPSPLLDRLRVIEMPDPTFEDIDALLPPLLAEAAREQDLDPRWAEPLTAEEKGLLASKWSGGSVRRLRGYLAVVLRVRDRERRRH